MPGCQAGVAAGALVHRGESPVVWPAEWPAELAGQVAEARVAAVACLEAAAGLVAGACL